MELVYLCTGQTATSVAVRKHTREATAKTVRFLFLEQYFQKYFARVLFVSDSFWAIIHRLFTSHWLVLRNINFMPLLFIFSVLSVSVDNDCSCSSGPEGKQRCKIGQLIFHLQVKVAWNSFPRHLYRIYIKNPKKATFPLRSQTKFTRVHKMIKVWSDGHYKATTIDVLIYGKIPLHSFLDRSRNTKPISSHLDRTSFFNKGSIL